MRPFVFGCDAHIAEPPDLYVANLPAHLKGFAINAEVVGNIITTKIGDRKIFKVQRDFHEHKIGQHGSIDASRKGARNIGLRLMDMERDGVDAELVFPSLGLMAHRIDNREAALATAHIYNDWAREFTAPARDTLIPAAIIPVVNLDDALAELKRVATIGYAAAMLPLALLEGVTKYNELVWEPIFAVAGESDIPVVFHTGTGPVNIRALHGPGGALFNYTRQMNDVVDVIAMLVGGGVLDRNAKARILFLEHGAGWLMGLAERMDEVYHGHAPSISPKLSRRPSQIVRDQVRCSFPNDIGCLITRGEVGTDALLFATDYPHSEGTFPFSRQLVDRMFDKVPDITQSEKEAVLGLNAARLFKHANLLANATLHVEAPRLVA